MQNPVNSTTVSAVNSGIIPPPVQCQQPLHMQSTTPSVAIGKDEMRGWLYKWTNVKLEIMFFLFLRINHFSSSSI